MFVTCYQFNVFSMSPTHTADPVADTLVLTSETLRVWFFYIQQGLAKIIQHSKVVSNQEISLTSSTGMIVPVGVDGFPMDAICMQR